MFFLLYNHVCGIVLNSVEGVGGDGCLDVWGGDGATVTGCGLMQKTSNAVHVSYSLKIGIYTQHNEVQQKEHKVKNLHNTIQYSTASVHRKRGVQIMKINHHTSRPSLSNQ